MKNDPTSILIQQILSQPTAPFRESWVAKIITDHCKKWKLPYFEDSYGNVWVGASGIKDARTKNLVFVAHIDHPGVVIEGFAQRAGKTFAHGTWLGGGPLNLLGEEMLVFSHVNAGTAFKAKVSSHTVNGKRGAHRVTLEVLPGKLFQWNGEQQKLAPTQVASLLGALCSDSAFSAFGPWGACLWYSKHGIPNGVKKQGPYWQTKAADDLIGVCALLLALRKTFRASKRSALLFSRAEESGFHGSLWALENRLLSPKRTRIVSVETSSALPGATPGNGPVVRLGDRSTVFSPGLVHWTQSQASALLSKRVRKGAAPFRFQRRVMDGGSCEATAFNAFGFEVAGLSTPLIHYHNVNWEQVRRAKSAAAQKRAQKPLPEAVHTQDVIHLVQLLEKMMLEATSLGRSAHGASLFLKTRRSLVDNFRKETRLYWEE
jgi:putative aminopeptidase FrvX